MTLRAAPSSTDARPIDEEIPMLFPDESELIERIALALIQR